MKNVGTAAIVICASVFLAGASAGDTKKPSAGPSAVVSRYSGIANVKRPGGGAETPLRVDIKDWHFVRTPEGVRLPEQGFYIAQLTSGQIDTKIGGKVEHRHAGDFWTVAEGESLTVNFPPHSQAAQIKTIAIAPGAGKR